MFGTTGTADNHTRDKKLETFVDQMVEDFGFSRAGLLSILSSVETNDRIIELISRPAERTLTWEDYRKIFITDKRIDEGIEFVRNNGETLARAEATFDVPPEIIAAIAGVETSYGNIQGGFPVIEALVTLGFDYPPRAGFFLDQLREFLLLACEEQIAPFTDKQACDLEKSEKLAAPPVDHLSALKGSYAGAMGIGQFIPSSFRNFAIDFNEDGIRNIWTNWEDAIGSIANYFAAHAWRNENPRMIRVDTLPPSQRLSSLINSTLIPEQTLAQWNQMGLVFSADPDERKATLHGFETHRGKHYYLGLHDFYVITRYNHSHMYARVVHELAELILQGAN